MIDKRECRKYADPLLTINANHGLLNATQIKYIIRTAVKNIAGSRYLLLYLYDRENAKNGNFRPAYTIFHLKNDYITLDQRENSKTKWLSSSFFNMEHSDYFAQYCVFYSNSDEQKVIRYFKSDTEIGFNSLKFVQMTIMEKRLLNKIHKRDKKIIERMEAVKPLPRDLKTWIHREVMPAYIFYKYKNSRKPMDGYCTYCKNDVKVSEAKHNKKGECPNCKKEITFKAMGKSMNVYDQATAQVLQKTESNEIIVRIIKTNKIYGNHFRDPKINIWENARFFLRNNDENKLINDPYYYSYKSDVRRLTQWKNGVRPVMNQWCINFENEIRGYLYTRNLDKVLKDTPWQYSQIKSFYLSHHEPLEVAPYFYSYNNYPCIEYLIKLKLNRIAASVIYHSFNFSDDKYPIIGKGKNLHEILGIEQQDLWLLQKIDATVSQLSIFKNLKFHGYKCDEVFINWYGDNGITSEDDVIFPLKFTTTVKLVNYIERQFQQLFDGDTNYGRFRNIKSTLSQYRDYLYMANRLEYNLSNSICLFPKNLMDAHDIANNLYDEKVSEINNKLISESYIPLMKRLNHSDDEFEIIVPKNVHEIVAEGKTLKHCVSTYVTKVADKKCIILFLRKKEHMEEPFFTIEVRDNCIVQIYGENHKSPTPEVKNYLDIWKKKVRIEDKQKIVA